MFVRGLAMRRLLAGVLLTAALGGLAAGDDLLLKSGITLRGNVIRIAGLNARTISQNNSADVPASVYWMCDDGVRRYFVLRKLAPDVVDADLSRGILFELKHERRGSRGIPGIIGMYQKT